MSDCAGTNRPSIRPDGHEEDRRPSPRRPLQEIRLSNGDRADKRTPGAAEEGNAGAEQEAGVGQDPDDGQHRQPAEDVPSEIDVSEIRPDIDKAQDEVES